MMRLLTGASSDDAFDFVPRSVAAFGSTVLADGTDPTRSLYWVHAWTVGPDGVITQVREYFNTALTVTRFGYSSDVSSPASSSPPPTSSSKKGSPSAHCWPLWQSDLPETPGKSLPGLVLAI
ncbi:wound-induced protein 1 [Typha latifolia]|uniref:wound-induced protein 1 n=1 Tax=Typha latifolia TaxID=4733 RepID=UPI003C2B3F4A